MKAIIFKLLIALLLFFLILPIEGFSKGGGKGGYGRSYGGHSSYSSGKGGHYTGGSGSSHRGGHYSNPSTGNHYKKEGGASSSHALPNSHIGSSSTKSSSSLTYHPSVTRDSKGRIIRSESAKEAFLKSRGLKKIPPGYQVDHIIPLYAGGSDTPSNMQLLPNSEHKAKTKADYQRYGR